MKEKQTLMEEIRVIKEETAEEKGGEQKKRGQKVGDDLTASSVQRQMIGFRQRCSFKSRKREYAEKLWNPATG